MSHSDGTVIAVMHPGAEDDNRLETLANVWRYIDENPDRFRDALLTHVQLSLLALVAALAIFVPLGVLSARSRTLGPPIIAAVAAARVVPSLAVLFLLYPYRQEVGDLLPMFDRNFALALIALTALAGPPIIINTDAGLRGVEAAVLENARGLGMKPRQVFARVHLPLALPVVIAGVRTAGVEVVASATLAAFIGTGSLGRFINSGLTLLDTTLLLVGAIPVTLLALTVEGVLAWLERLVTPAGLTP
ncbi:MAG: ABC transporter permease [Thermomicrobiales bacterium]